MILSVLKDWFAVSSSKHTQTYRNTKRAQKYYTNSTKKQNNYWKCSIHQSNCREEIFTEFDQFLFSLSPMGIFVRIHFLSLVLNCEIFRLLRISSGRVKYSFCGFMLHILRVNSILPSLFLFLTRELQFLNGLLYVYTFHIRRL